MFGLNFSRKAAPTRGATDAPRQPEVIYLSSGIGVAIVKWNNYVAAEQALCHPIVFRALDKIASSVQQVPWFAEVDPDAPKADQDGKARVVADLNALLRSPNDGMTPAQLRYWMALNWATYGRVPMKVGVTAMDLRKPSGLYPLEAKFVRAYLDNRGAPQKYEYGSGETKQPYPSRIAHTKNPTSKGFVDEIWKTGLRGYRHKDEQNTPLQAVGLPAQVIKSLLIRAIQTAEGHPNVRYMVTCEKTLTEPQKKALKRVLNEDHGPEGPDAGKVPILQNVGKLEIHKLENDLSDIHSKMPSDDMARIIFGAFGIPIALAGMGAADGAKFAGNYVESRLAFWEDTIVPMYVSPLFQGLTSMLCPTGVRISADLEQVPAMVHGRITSMKEVETVSFLSANEKRAMFGYAPTGAAASNGGNEDE